MVESLSLAIGFAIGCIFCLIAWLSIRNSRLKLLSADKGAFVKLRKALAESYDYLYKSAEIQEQIYDAFTEISKEVKL